MKPSTIIQATKCVSLLYLIQNELDLLEEGGFKMEKDLKYKAKNFREVLDKNIARFYKDMDLEAQNQHINLTNKITYAINNEVIKEFKLASIKELYDREI